MGAAEGFHLGTGSPSRNRAKMGKAAPRAGGSRPRVRRRWARRSAEQDRWCRWAEEAEIERSVTLKRADTKRKWWHQEKWWP
mmetsp:Transcript_20247/g.32112  ORF Transcript_20247/g.32112 Transcript_20247/m.32112 type:complete len:82 (-) Transcript_20247:112-357(-)